MADTTFQRVEAIFHQAVDRRADERAAFLDDACAGNDRIRREVERLLALDGRDAGLLDTAPWKHDGPALEVEVTVDPLARPGARIGRYRLLERISVGGMGTVWLAERADRQFLQKVAVKLIKRGMDTEDILRRFRTERQVLAGLQHPNIARLLDGGATEDGRPYLVMEHIEGRPIDAYCDERGLPVPDRLTLFMKVCRAVQVAHRNLVIHRDLKPSNIMVTADGEPKLLDFGIAKLLTEEGAAVTATGLRVMTPLYASPEQIRGDRITTASDVYGLGVVLYELITGRGPYRLTTRSRSEIERAVLSQEPDRPSTAVGRRTDSGDLDTIVLKALSKAPESRYGSPEQLAEDLQRHLDGRPILARPAGVGTRIVKTLRRNRRAVAAAAAGGAVSLVLAIAVSLYVFVVPDWVQEHVDAARQELLHPHQGNAIYISVYWHDAAAGGGPPPESFRRAVSRYDAALRWYPMRDDIRRERDVVRRALGEPAGVDPAALDDRSRGLLAVLTGDFATAFRAWARLDLVSDPDPLVEGLLGILYLALDEPARAYPRLTTAHRAFPDAGFLCVSLADAAVHCGDTAQAQVLIERARHLSGGHDNTGSLARVEADVLAATGRHDEAMEIYLGSAAGSPVAWLHYADLLAGTGRPREGLAVLAGAVRLISRWMKVNRIFRERADDWWARLGDTERRALVASTRSDDPTDRESFSMILFAYRAATLSLARGAPPVNPLGGAVPEDRPIPAVSPSLAELSEPIPLTDLKAWACAVKPYTWPEGLESKVRADLAGPHRTLSPATLREYLAWEAGAGPYFRRSIGFADPPVPSQE